MDLHANVSDSPYAKVAAGYGTFFLPGNHPDKSMWRKYLQSTADTRGHVRSKACVVGRSLAGIAGSNPAGGMDVCCQTQVSATGRSFIQRNPMDDSECYVL